MRRYRWTAGWQAERRLLEGWLPERRRLGVTVLARFVFRRSYEYGTRPQLEGQELNRRGALAIRASIEYRTLMTTFQHSQLRRAWDAIDAQIAGSMFPDRTRIGTHTHECDERAAGALIDAGFARRHRSWDDGISLTAEGWKAGRPT